MSAVLGGLLAASWKATLVVAVLLAVRTILRGWLPAAWRHGLWLLVALRLLLPLGPASPFSLFRLLDPAGGGSGHLLPGLGEVPASAGGAGAAGAAAGAAAWTGLDALVAVALLVWAAGVLVLAVRSAAGHLRLRAALAAARPVADPAVLDLLADCRRKLGVRGPVGLVESDVVSGPAVADPPLPGGARILLPTGLCERLGTDELRHVLLHELAHLKRRDGLAHRLGGLLGALHWFNPAIHFARRRMRADCEQAADALVLARLAAADRASYGRTLLRLVTPRPSVAAPAGLLTMTTTKRQLQRRIRMIARFRPYPLRRLPALAALAGALALASLTDVGGLAAEAGSKGAPPQGTAAAPATPQDAEHLEESVDAVRRTGVAIFNWYGDRLQEQEAGIPAPEPVPERYDWSRCPKISYEELTRLLAPKYIAEVPRTDGWGHPLEFCIAADARETHHYLAGIRSPGRDGRFEGEGYPVGPFAISEVDRDVVWIDGFFVTWPQRQPAPGG